MSDREIVENLVRYLSLVIEKAQLEKGGPGSGNWGHAGRPGKRGGSVSAGGGAGGAALGGAQIEEGGTSLNWRDEETVTGQITITGVNLDAGEPSQDDVASWLRSNLDTLELQGDDIEEIDFERFEVGGNYVYAEVSILPTGEAAETWFEGAYEREALGTYYE